jgi:hypothetical protein
MLKICSLQRWSWKVVDEHWYMHNALNNNSKTPACCVQFLPFAACYMQQRSICYLMNICSSHIIPHVFLQHWDLDDEYEHQGSHVFLPGGNLRLLEGLAQGIPTFYNATARLLQYSSTGVRMLLVCCRAVRQRDIIFCIRCWSLSSNRLVCVHVLCCSSMQVEHAR